MNIRTLMTTTLVTLLLVGGAQAKDGDNYLKNKGVYPAMTSTAATKMVATNASENNGNRWIRRESDRI